MKNVIRSYPQLKKDYELSVDTLGAASMSGMPSGSDVGRPAEQTAIRTISTQDYREYSAVKKALEYTALLERGEQRCRMIDLLYFKRKYHRIEDAAYEAHISDRSGLRYNGEFIRLVALNLGFELKN